MRKGLDEDEVQAAVGDLDATGEGSAAALLPTKTVAALRLVDLLVSEHPAVDDAAYRRLRDDFDDGELLELSAVIVIGSGWQKMIEAFGIRPDHWTDTTPLPWKGQR